jgi:hypothetical protein
LAKHAEDLAQDGADNRAAKKQENRRPELPQHEVDSQAQEHAHNRPTLFAFVPRLALGLFPAHLGQITAS